MSPKVIKRQECIIYSRCCGWYSAYHQGNPGKQAEYKDRKPFDIKESK